MSSLLKPYPDTGNLTQQQKHYNFKLSSTRMIVENANARLKNKWRRLKLIDCKTIERAKDIIMACLVLHNFLLCHDTLLTRCSPTLHVFNPEIVFTSAEHKRDYIASYLMNEN